MSEREFEGASESEAVAAAAAALGVKPEEVDYTVLDEGAEAVFGLGGRPAKIRVATESEGPEPAVREDKAPARKLSLEEEAQKLESGVEIVTELLKRMGLSGGVRGENGEEEITLFVTDDEGKSDIRDLFGSVRPPLAPALQFLVNKMINRFPEDRKHILIEVEGVVRPKRASRIKVVDGEEQEEFDPELVATANLLAARAKATGKVISINPMRASERRAVHQTVMGFDGAKTVSSGEGLYRELHVLSDRGGRGGRRRRRSGSSEANGE